MGRIAGESGALGEAEPRAKSAMSIGNTVRQQIDG